jgi:hypothetical protein
VRVPRIVLWLAIVILSWVTFLSCYRLIQAEKERDAAIALAKKTVREYVSCYHEIKYE